jgi:hypothetical protein
MPHGRPRPPRADQALFELSKTQQFPSLYALFDIFPFHRNANVSRGNDFLVEPFADDKPEESLLRAERKLKSFCEFLCPL